ncbi:TspO/MBR family protein [Rhizobium sp.]
MTASQRSYPLLGIFLIVVLGVGFTIGLTIRPGEWYQALSKPFFTPPNWLFGPAWTLVYTLIAIAGWRVAGSEGLRSAAFRLWILQMVLNWAWTPVFFGLHLTGAGLVVIACLLVTVMVFMSKVRDRPARWCFVPYALWLCYATALNAAIFALN